MVQNIKIITEDFSGKSVNDGLEKINNLTKKITDEVEITFVSLAYNVSFSTLKSKQATFNKTHKKIQFFNFYSEKYFQSERKNNVQDYLMDYFSDDQVVRTKSKKGTPIYSDGIKMRGRITKKAKSYTIDLFDSNTNQLEKRLFVNSDDNIQAIRTFDLNTSKPLTEMYLDSELTCYLAMDFDSQKKLNAFYLYENEVTYSRMQLYENWLKKVINDDDLIVNLNKDLTVVFESWMNPGRIFELS